MIHLVTRREILLCAVTLRVYAADSEFWNRKDPSEWSADEVDRWAAFLESEGVAIGARPRTHRDGARSCYFRDPDGNSIQIIHHPPISDKV